jgi:glycosyltransferase involved in cell wall biosynthesis
MNRLNNPYKNMLGAAIIVRDAENTISTAVKSVLPVTSQVVVVDTGSLDSTPSICQKLGAELYFYEWSGSFAKARNYCLQFMRTEWIIQIDADEELIENSLTDQLSHFNDIKIGGLSVILQNLINPNDNTQYSQHRYARIFRNHRQIRYKGDIHEQINESINTVGYDIVDSNVIIRHFGYLHNSVDRQERNKSLLMKELQENPDDAYLLYHLAETEFAAGNMDKAGATFLQVVDSEFLSANQREMSRIRLAQIALKYENLDSINRWLDFRSSDIHKEGLRLYILCVSLVLGKQYKEASKLIDSPKIWCSPLVNQADALKLKDALSQIPI